MVKFIGLNSCPFVVNASPEHVFASEARQSKPDDFLTKNGGNLPLEGTKREEEGFDCGDAEGAKRGTGFEARKKGDYF